MENITFTPEDVPRAKADELGFDYDENQKLCREMERLKREKEAKEKGYAPVE